MPVMDCIKDGKAGHKWGKNGFCYTGSDSQSKAAAQGRAIKAAQNQEDPVGGSLLKDDPTHTITIRSKWNAEFTRRYTQLKGDINRLILKNEINVTVNQAFDFRSDVQSIAEFLAFLQTQIDTRIFDNAVSPGTSAGDFWQNIYITRGYERGVRIATAELKKQGKNIQGVLENVTPAVVTGTAIPSIGIGFSALSNPIHLDAIQALYIRDFAQLKGITQTMSGQIARVLTDGIEQGLSARQLAKNINDRVDKIGLTRSKLLARTETVRAYNIAGINEGRSLEASTGVKVLQEWVTAGDEKVRSTHAGRNRKVFEPNVAAGLIGEPNCRCSLVPFIEELDTVKDRTERTVIRKQGLQRIA